VNWPFLRRNRLVHLLGPIRPDAKGGFLVLENREEKSKKRDNF
jgi:hypothetical protein